MKHLIAIGLIAAGAFALANSNVPLVKLDAYEVSTPAATSMPACCYSPRSRWDERCAGARFDYAPGTSSDPGTWPGYSPWQGDCQQVGPNDGGGS